MSLKNIVKEFKVERLYRDFRVTTICEETSVQRIVIAREFMQD